MFGKGVYLMRVPGLRYFPNYIPAKEHFSLLDAIYRQEWQTDLRRRVQHYGYRYDYRRRNIDLSMFLGELPPWGKQLGQRLYEDGYLSSLPDQMIVNEYLPGQGIAPHVDCEPCFGDTIICISLGSQCVMDFIQRATGQKVSLLLEVGSVLILQGAARYDWQHGIAKRQTDEYDGLRFARQKRVSLTFRKVVIEEPAFLLQR